MLRHLVPRLTGPASLLLLVPALLVGPPATAAPDRGGEPRAARPTCLGQRATIVGTPRRDRIVGTPRRDVIVGLGGDDRIDGRGGDDLVCGGEGADLLRGGPGDDRLDGGLHGLEQDRGGSYSTPDVLQGGPGDDVLDVGLDTRTFDESSPRGVVSYDASPRRVRVDLGRGRARGEGTDRIVDRPGLEVVGSRRDDLLVGGPGGDNLTGGPGDDVLRGLGGTDVLSGDPFVTRARAVHDDDDVDGGEGDDQLLTERGSDTLRGGSGADELDAFSARPARLLGEDGDDALTVSVSTAGTGWVADGGPGADAVTTQTPGFRAYEPGSPSGATLTVRAATGVVERSGAQVGTLVGFEQLSLAGELRWEYLGTDGPDVVEGGSRFPFRAETYGGDDTVTGTYEADYIDAGDGTDTVDAGDGADTCIGVEVATSC